MVGGIWTQVLETITSPHTEPGAVFISQAILVFGIAALVFTALHTKRPLRWWVGSVVHLIAGAILPFTADLVSFFIAWELVTIGAGLIPLGLALAIKAAVIPAHIWLIKTYTEDYCSWW